MARIYKLDRLKTDLVLLNKEYGEELESGTLEHAARIFDDITWTEDEITREEYPEMLDM